MISIEVAQAVKLHDWIKRAKRETVCARDVMRLGPYAIQEAPVAKAALRMLHEHGWLLTEDGRHYTAASHAELDA